MEKPLIIVVEGPQGTGKTTITNGLREKISYSTMIRETGTRVSSPEQAYEYHYYITELMVHMSKLNLNFILDRSHTTEMAYCDVGLKEHTFEEESRKLNVFYEKMTENYSIHFVLLTADAEAFRTRLARDKSDYLNAKFDVSSSLKQCESYERVFKKLEKECPSAKFHYIDTSKLTAEQVINEILNKTREDTK